MKIKTKRNLFICIFLVCVIIAAVIIVLTQTSTKTSDTQNADKIQYYNQMYGFQFSTEDGLYFEDSTGFLRFYDFNSKGDAKVCNKPNCKHETWNEDTPDEQRCNAYLNASSARGFINDNKLYVLAVDNEQGMLILTRSELDRSNQTVIAQLSSTVNFTMAVKDSTLYSANVTAIMDTDTEGLPAPTGKTNTCLYAIDLQSGETMEYGKQTGYNASLRIIGASDDLIYLGYEAFKNAYDGTNFKEAVQQSQLFTFNTNTKKYTLMSIPTDNNSSYQYVCGKKIIGYKLSGSFDTYDSIFELDLDTKGIKTIIQSPEHPKYLEGALIYKSHEGYFTYNIEQGTSNKMPYGVISQFYILQDVGKYIYGSKPNKENQPDTIVIISKEDFYNNNPNFIELNYYEDHN